MKQSLQLQSDYLPQTHVAIKITRFFSGNVKYELYAEFRRCYPLYATLETIHDVRIQRRKLKLIGWHKSFAAHIPGMYTLTLMYTPKKIKL